jgi:DNA-binding CsgD family transcriptional regulator
MSTKRSAKGDGSFDARERKALALAAKRLDAVPANGSVDMVFDAIAACVPIAAGLVQVLNPDSPEMMACHMVRQPFELTERWIGTPRAHLARAFLPVLRAEDGDFWRAENLATSVRAQLSVLALLDRNGIGEGAGYKVCTRPAPTGGVEHISLALLAPHRQRFSPRAPALLKKLAPDIRGALLRLALPVVAARPLLAQYFQAVSVGYVALDGAGGVRELNRRAYDLVHLYASMAGIARGRQRMAAFVARVRAEVDGGRTWYVGRGSSTLEVRPHVVRAAAHGIPEDLLLVTLRELQIPDDTRPFTPPPGVRLTRRQREIAELLVRTALSYEAIGARLEIKVGTVRAVVPAIYRAYDVTSRSELADEHRRRMGEERPE